MVKSLNSLVKKIGKKFKEKNLSLVTAESCTGGGLAYYISKCPQCSSILERGYVTYSHPSKESALQVKQVSLQMKGAVSKEVAVEMAIGALKNSQAQVSISITGIAGPDRENIKKIKNPVGIVWISCTDFYGTQIIKQKEIKGSRERFIHEVILEALLILLQYIENFPASPTKK